MRIRHLALALAGVFAVGSAQAATEIQWWHAMAGKLGERVTELANEFNASQQDYKVTPVYKGNYGETMNAGIAAFRGGNAPHILQVFEVGTATMMSAKGAVQPVQDMMEKAGEKFDPAAYIPAVAGYYSTTDGKMLSMPFNSSTPVMHYNKDLFKKAGLDPEAPPKTWQELVEAGKKLKAAGVECAYTTTWPSWVQLETFSAWHNVAYASKNNGFDGVDARLEITSDLHKRHIGNLAQMAKDGLFTYGGRAGNATALFQSGQCAMLTGSSGDRAGIIEASRGKFEFGTSTLPYYEGVEGAPQNTIIGGASLWVFANKSAEEYKGVSKFFTFLSSPEIQARWHQQTGYLPITVAAYDLTRESGFYDKNPGADVSVQQMVVKTTDKSRGVRLGFLPQIRDLTEEELELAFSGKQTAEQALQKAQQRGNELLERFEKSVK